MDEPGVCFFIVHYLSTYLHFWSQTVQFVLDNGVDTFMLFIQVWTFWEAHKNLCNLPHALDIYFLYTPE